MNLQFDSTELSLAISVLSAVIGSLFGAASSTIVPLPPIRLSTVAETTSDRVGRMLERYSASPGRIAFRWQVARIGCVAVTAVFMGQALSRMNPQWTVPLALLGTMAIYGILVQLFALAIRTNPTKQIPRLFVLLCPLQRLVSLFTFPLEAASKALFGSPKQAQQVLPLREPQQELGVLLEEGRRYGAIEDEPLEMIKNVLELRDQTAMEVMVPRTKVVAFSTDTLVSEALDKFIESGHSRYPVYKNTIDNIVGLLYAKDLFRVFQSHDTLDTSIEPLVRHHVNFVPEAKPASVLLREMKVKRQHMAIVLDDFGGVSGIVTLEDILEEIVGDIWDEHDSKKSMLNVLNDGRVSVDASIGLEDLMKHLGITINHSADIVSLAGWVVQLAKRVPTPGETFSHDGLMFTVTEADARHVTRVEIAREDGKPLHVSVL